MRRREVDRLVASLRSMGYQVKPTRSGHYSVRAGGAIVVLPGSPSDHRSLRNAMALLRRAGVAL